MSELIKHYSSVCPGYIIFLIDQSATMSECYEEEKTKAGFTALVINQIINDIIYQHMDGDRVKDRVYISLIGYGGKEKQIADIRHGYISEYAENPIKIKKTKKIFKDGVGGLIEVEIENPIFIEPVSDGTPSLIEGIEYTKELMKNWIKRKSKNPMPIVVNFTNTSTLNNLNSNEIAKLKTIGSDMKYKTSNGEKPLIFNVCLASKDNDNVFNNEFYKRILSEISTQIPSEYNLFTNYRYNFDISKYSNGFLLDETSDEIIKFMEFIRMLGVY